MIKKIIDFVRQPFAPVQRVEARIAKIKADNGIYEIERRIYELECQQADIINQIKLDRQLTQIQAEQIREELQDEIDKLRHEVKHSKKRGLTSTDLFNVFTSDKKPPNLRRRM